MDYYEIKEREVNDIRQNSKQRKKKTDISYIQKDDHRTVTYYKRANSLVLFSIILRAPDKFINQFEKKNGQGPIIWIRGRVV
jgi:hypothetical protein